MELREELKTISEQLQGLTQTRAICESMTVTKSIKILEMKGPLKEGETPVEVDINGDIVVAVIDPILRLINQKKEGLLARKEKVLATLEAQITAPMVEQKDGQT